MGRPAVELSSQMERQRTFKRRFVSTAAIGEVEFVAFDTELTGLDFSHDSILSIGAVKLTGTRIHAAETFYKLVQPESALKPESVVIHQITHTDLAQAEPLQDAMDEFVSFIGDAVLLGHFVHIDVHFVNRALKKLYGRRLANPAVDTATLHDWLYDNDSRFARHHRGMTSKNDLFSMAKRYGIEGGKAHNAFSDAYLTAQLFQRLACFLPACGVRSIRELMEVARP